MMERPLYRALAQALARSKAMVFMSGPRQAGKTTLAKAVAGGYPASLYFNWDIREDRVRLLDNPSFFTALDNPSAEAPLIVLDEIHKYRRWKNYLKGIYDAHADRYRFLVLGSGRLNIFQRGGDSLAGRYFMFSVWPFTIAELMNRRRSIEDLRRDPLDSPPPDERGGHLWKQLGERSGFPEPFLADTPEVYRRWSSSYHQQLIREDIRDATDLKRLDDLEALSLLLPSKAGSPLSIESLARDIEVSFKTVQAWMETLERFYLCFRLRPWFHKIARGLKKQAKLYLYDYPQIESAAARFENMVAVELWRAVSHWNEWGWGVYDLLYIRNKDGQEVDFLITERRRPWLLIEAKEAETEVAPALLKFQERLKIPALQLVNRPGVSRRDLRGGMNISVRTASDWLSGLP